MSKSIIHSGHGYSIYELVIALAVLGILAAIAIPFISYPYRSKIEVAEALTQIRDLQGLSVYHIGDIGRAPNMGELAEMYGAGTELDITTKFEIIDSFGDSDRGHGNDPGGWDSDNPGRSNKPHVDIVLPEFIIYTTRSIEGVNYVYGIADDPPRVAYGLDHPLAVYGINP